MIPSRQRMTPTSEAEELVLGLLFFTGPTIMLVVWILRLCGVV